MLPSEEGIENDRNISDSAMVVRYLQDVYWKVTSVAREGECVCVYIYIYIYIYIGCFRRNSKYFRRW